MDPLELYWKTLIPIPGTPWTIRGYSRAAYRTGFYIPELNILLDAGPQFRGKPEHIFITHCHSDHIAQLPFTLIQERDADSSNTKIQIYAPKQSEEWLRQYITALFNVNACRYLRKQVEEWYTFNPMEVKEFPLILRNNPYNIEVFICDHPVPTVSYGFQMIKYKLKDEYLGLPGFKIAQMRKEGIEIYRTVIHKSFAFVCDTTIRVFQLNPSLLSYKTIMIECTFLKEADSNSSEHITWSELKPIVLSNPEVYFMLFHFSMRYKAVELKTFFEDEKLANVKAVVEEF